MEIIQSTRWDSIFPPLITRAKQFNSAKLPYRFVECVLICSDRAAVSPRRRGHSHLRPNIEWVRGDRSALGAYFLSPSTHSQYGISVRASSLLARGFLMNHLIYSRRLNCAPTRIMERRETDLADWATNSVPLVSPLFPIWVRLFTSAGIDVTKTSNSQFPIDYFCEVHSN